MSWYGVSYSRASPPVSGATFNKQSLRSVMNRNRSQREAKEFNADAGGTARIAGRHKRRLPSAMRSTFSPYKFEEAASPTQPGGPSPLRMSMLGIGLGAVGYGGYKIYKRRKARRAAFSQQ